MEIFSWAVTTDRLWSRLRTGYSEPRLKGAVRAPRDATPVDRGRESPYLGGMEMVRLKPERKAQLDDYAKRQGQDPAAALDDVLAAYFDEQQQDYTETIQAVQEAYEDVKAGRTRSAAEFLEDLRLKHGLPR
ncbi:MAG: hypothetical protein JO336_05230 [Acidobacteriia bacterium]|nr:hypothetical protein [Terriglobia bacterium]